MISTLMLVSGVVLAAPAPMVPTDAEILYEAKNNCRSAKPEKVDMKLLAKLLKIEKQYGVARTQGQTTSALKALELLSRVRGNNIDADEITTESLEQEIVKGMEIIGIEKVLELMSQAFPEEMEDEEDESLLTTEELKCPPDS